jgi:hypothetical protein
MTEIEYSTDIHNIGRTRIVERSKDDILHKDNLEIFEEDIQWNSVTGRFEPVYREPEPEVYQPSVEEDETDVGDYDDEVYFNRETGRFEPVVRITRTYDRRLNRNRERVGRNDVTGEDGVTGRDGYVKRDGRVWVNGRYPNIEESFHNRVRIHW